MQLDPSLIGVASQVHSLLRQYDALDYFRDRVREAAREYLQAMAECKRREKLRRDTVAKKGVLSLPLDDEVVKEKTKDRYFFWSEEFRGRIKVPPDITEPLMPLTHGSQFPNRPAVPRCLSNGIPRDDWSEDDEREVDVFNKELTDWDKRRSDYVRAREEGKPSKWEEDKHRIFELAQTRSFPDDGDGGLPYVFMVEAFLPDKLSEDRDPATDGPLPVSKKKVQTSLNFLYAGLAAIYDAHWGGSERIAPWGVAISNDIVSPASGLPSEWKTSEEPGSYRAATWYWRLVMAAKELDARNTTIVNSWVADVETDLTAIQARGGQDDNESGDSYMPITRLWEQRFGKGSYRTRDANKFFEENKHIRFQKSRTNRREVHNGDWEAHWRKVDRRAFESLDNDDKLPSISGDSVDTQLFLENAAEMFQSIQARKARK